MALSYNILFQENLPDAYNTTKSILDQLCKIEKLSITDENKLALDYYETLGFNIYISNKEDYYEMQINEAFQYKNEIIFIINKEYDNKKRNIYLIKFWQMLQTFISIDVVVLYNRELIILRRIKNQLFINIKSGFWDYSECIEIIKNEGYLIEHLNAY